ncbi:ras GEF, partial [Meira miltonrushii]
EEYVVALHDFASNNETCLSFVSGQVIRVFNRDESGWWDGELDGQRGWFPSNYVDESGLTSDSNAFGFSERDEVPEAFNPDRTVDGFDQVSSESARETLGSSGSSHHTATYANNRHLRRPNGAVELHAPMPSIVEPIQHAISLLHNAVRANRIAHFQPSTACVISSVRSVLSSTDCLTRESSVLKAHPVLAKERKQILAELSRLVTQARRASDPTFDNASLAQEMEIMLRMADQVIFNVKRFLDVAVECGVHIPDKHSSVYDDMYDDGRLSATTSRQGGNFPNRFDQDKTPTPDSPRSSTYRTAFTSDHVSPRSSRSYVDLRGSNPPLSTFRGEGNALTVAARIKAQALNQNGSTPNLFSTNTSATDARAHAEAYAQDGNSASHGSHSPEGSGDSETHSDERRAESSEGSDEGPIPSVPKECAPAEVMERIQHANDHLLSIIAAFIGHIHGHTRESHASSYAFLIDMTRATVDGVRNLLVIVEAVHGCQELASKLPKQMQILWETRESVYEATASLVTAARVITSSAKAEKSPSLGDGEDDEKQKLLQAATIVLRAGGECVGAVKLCLNRAPASLRITLAMPSSLHAQSQRSQSSTSREGHNANDQGDEEAEAGERHIEAAEVRRNKHTLSYLGRKATSLSCLRERYEQDVEGPATPSSRFADVAEEANEDSSDVFVSIDMNTLDPNDETKKNANNTQQSEAAESSDSSEPMSRDHSRTSASTLHSTHSITTPSTSARPSMDRGEHAASNSLGQHQQINSEIDARNRSGSSASVGRLSQMTTTTSEASSPASISSPSFPSPPKRVGRSLSSDARILAPDYDSSEICFNSEGQLTGATLKALVEKMTPHNTTIDATLSNAFFLCFRLFTTPMELFEVLEARYNMRAPAEIELNADDFTRWTELKVAPVRLRVFNFFKLWLENHWNGATDHCILEKLIEFTQTSMMHSLNKPGQRLAELANRRLSAGPSAKMQTVAVTSPGSGGSGTRGPGSLKRMVSADRVVKTTPGLTEIVSMYTPNATPKSSSAPQPIVSKTLMTQLKQLAPARVNVMDFDPLELSRQLTIMESRIYCSILPEELLGQEFSKKVGVSNAINVKRMSALSTHITGWVSECILNEDDARKRTQLVKFFIKLGDRCLMLNNFNALFAVQSALNSSTIARLKKTWDGLPSKYRTLMEQQRKAVEHTRNFAGYRQRLRSIMPPALPFVGLFLTDLTFCHEGNASTRPSPADPNKRLLNFDKYVKMSRIIGDLQRFQTPYNLSEVAEIQEYLQTMLESSSQSGKNAVTAEELYRRSLRLEPRNNSNGTIQTGHGLGVGSTVPDGISSLNTVSNRTGLGSVGGLDIFNWK